MSNDDIRWQQRLDNFHRALAQLRGAVEYAQTAVMSDILRLSLVKAFELAFELAWNVMKDFLSAQGVVGIIGSKDAVRQAFQAGLIADGQVWMAMIEDRNAATHTYNQNIADALVRNIRNLYYRELTAFAGAMERRK
ncbi:MAG: nucleotidyltransferase substrate binding protein [Planctomycetota bacterium]|jgi:nucleotidyltransferase substrate binding protein (TIGR01987 family)|nr:nucleotidyltransferase substrate binding protein [Planctomycetota bacterium]